MNTLYMYVLTKISWDYNDEYYTSSESDSGVPILISKREDLLLARAKDLTLEKLKSCCLADYFQEWHEDVRDLCESAGIDMYDYHGNNSLPDDIAIKIYDLRPRHFYRVDKVEVY